MKQFGWLVFLLSCAVSAWAQSTNQDFPTPVAANEISAAIPARDIGDSRLTRHFYTFFANNGDLNLEIVTENFDGDMDIFEAGTLRPLAKITIYDNGAAQKSSRIIYFRQREQVVLRIEGRTLTDAAARYQINFGGGFETAANLPKPPEDLVPTVSQRLSDEAVSRVNSAGAIIEVLPPKKPAEEPKPEPEAEPETKPEEPETVAAVAPKPRKTRPTAAPKPKPTRKPAAEPEAEAIAVAKPKPKPAAEPKAPRPTRRKPTPRHAETPAPEPPAPDPLANVRLTILLKNGDQIERPMSDIFRVSVDKGQLTVITKDGKIERWNLLDVLKFSIEQ